MTARTYDELFEHPYHLTLERESADAWTVVDVPTGTIMFRSPSSDTAIRFMAAFVARTQGATMMAASDTHYSWRVDAEPAWERAQEATRTNVYPLFHEQIDEAS